MGGDPRSPEVGSRWVDDQGRVWTCWRVSGGIVALRRSYREPGTPGFCGPYDVMESQPLPVALFAKLFRPAPEEISA